MNTLLYYTIQYRFGALLTMPVKKMMCVKCDDHLQNLLKKNIVHMLFFQAPIQ